MQTNVKLVNVPTIGVEYRCKNKTYTILQDGNTKKYALYEYSVGFNYNLVGCYYKTIEECCLNKQNILPESWFSKEEVMEHGDRFQVKVGDTTTGYGIVVEIIRGSNNFRVVVAGNKDNITFQKQFTLEELTVEIRNFFICHRVELDN